MTARRVEEYGVNEKVPPQVGKVQQGVQVSQVKQVPIVGQGNEVPVVPRNMNNRRLDRLFFL